MGLKEGSKLESTFLNDVEGFRKEVKYGSKLSLVSLDKYKDYRELKNRKEDQRTLIGEIGSPPYKLLEIHSHPPFNVITFNVEGEKEGKKVVKKEISKFRFTAY